MRWSQDNVDDDDDNVLMMSIHDKQQWNQTTTMMSMLSLDSKLNPKSRKYSKLLYKQGRPRSRYGKESRTKKSLLWLMLKPKDPNSAATHKLNHSGLTHWRNETKRNENLLGGWPWNFTTSTWCYWALYNILCTCQTPRHSREGLLWYQKALQEQNGSDPITSEMVAQHETTHIL